MSVTVSPAQPVVGQTLSFRLRFTGDPPTPNDVHIDVETEDGYEAVTGYDTIPSGLDPQAGFDIPVPPTPNWASPGTHRFRVRWTVDGKLVGTEAAYATTRPRSTAPERDKEWDWAVFWGKVFGGAGGSIVSGVLINWWTGAGILLCAVTGAIGGALGGAGSYVFAQVFDAPRIRWTFKTAFLFTLFFSLTFSMVFGLLSVDLEREWLAKGEIFNRVTLGVSLVSAFLAGVLAGVLNNLRQDSASNSGPDGP